MAKSYLLLVLLSSASIHLLVAQSSPKTATGGKMSDIIYLKVESVLETAGVLVPVEKEKDLDSRPLKANQAMRSNFRKEFVPLDDAYGKSTHKHLLPNWDMSYLGSTVFTSKTFVKPSTLDKPLLPIISNNKQFVVLSNGKFNLFYSITEFTNMAVNVEVEAKAASYVHAKLRSGLSYANKDKKSFNVSSGLFENELARIFGDAKSNGLKNKSEFLPLYFVWQAYATNILDTTKSYYILRNINAVVWHRDDKSSFSSHAEIEAALKAETPSLPYFKAKMDASVSWKSEKEKRSDFSLYDIYIMDEPPLDELISHNQILRAWKTLADDYNSDYGINLSPTGENIIEVTFGPITDGLQHSNITIDKVSFLKQFQASGDEKTNVKFVPLINDVSIVGDPQPESNSVRVKIKFVYNPSYFAGTIGKADIFNEIKQLKLVLGDPIKDKVLGKVYNITFNADAKMVPKISTSNNDDPTTSMIDGKYLWKFNVDYSFLPSANSEILPIDILQKTINFTHSQNDVLKGPGYLLKGACLKDANVSTRFNCEIELKDPKNLLSASEDYLVGELTLKAIARTSSLNTPYTRKLPVILRGIQPPIQINNDIVAFDSPDQIAKFFNKLKQVGGKTFDELTKEFTDDKGIVDYNKVGDILIKTFNISRDGTSGKYLVSSEFVDTKSYLTQQKTQTKN